MTSIYPSSTSSSTSNGTSSANLLRISGMASGIDTDAVVKSMVSNYQARIDKANQAKQTLQWKQEAYRDIIKDIKGLQDYFDPLSSKYMMSGKSLNINAAVSDNNSIASAIAGSTAKAGTYNVKVSQLAEQAGITSKSSLNSLVNIVDNTATKLDNWKGATLNLDTNLKLGAITDSNNFSGLVASINNKISADSTLKGKIVASYDTTNQKIIFENKSGSDINLNVNSSSNSSILSTTSIGKSSSISVSVTDATKWSEANLTFSNSITLADPIPDTTGLTGVGVDDIVANINSKISQNSLLSGKVSASYVSAGGNSYIKFTSASSMSLTAKTSDSTPVDIVPPNKSINSGISPASKLVSDLGFSEGTAKFSLTNGTTTSNVSLTVDSSTTIQNLIDAVNSATSGTITMSVDDATGKISFQSKSYGSTSNISITNANTSSTNVIKQLGIKDTATNTETVLGTSGKDAIVDITAPGQASPTTTTQSSNQFTLNGVSYNISGINNTIGANITVTGNSDTVVTNMKKFIEDYNSVISKINTKLTEKKDSNYAPLTDAQKESMSESQITAWETKAKVGILRNDDYLSTLMTQLRGVFSSPVYSSYDSSSPSTGKVALTLGKYGTNAIGIDTSTDYTDGGKLIITDETKLKSVIENNLEDFKKLFIGSSDSELRTNESYVGSKKYKEDGMFKRMDNILRDYVAAPGLGEDGTYTLSGSMNIFVNKQYDYSSTGSSGKNTLPDQVYSKTLSISKFQTQLSDAQTRYYAKFTALETAMNQLNSQQSQLSSMLGTA